MTPFSARENEIIKIIGRRKMTIMQIATALFNDDDYIDGRNIVSYCVKRINRKCERHDLNWTIAGEGRGRTGRTVWRERI